MVDHPESTGGQDGYRGTSSGSGENDQLVDATMVEEKKQVDPTEEDGGAAINHHKRDMMAGTSDEAEQRSPNHNAAPKETLNGTVLPSSSTTGVGKTTPAGSKSIVGSSSSNKNQDATGTGGPEPQAAPETMLSPTSTTTGSNPASAAPTQAHNNNNDDEDSSNDDSSYFADPNNLPSPGEAGRKYSFSSHPSTTRNHAKGRESDASLSLSEDSDENNNHSGHHHGSASAKYGNREAPEVFPQQRITRMHSVGSLVSTSSQNSEDDFGMRAQPDNRHHVIAQQRGYDPNNTNSNYRTMPVGQGLMYPSHMGPGPIPQYSQGGGMENRPYQPSYTHQLPMMAQNQWLAGATRNDQPQQQSYSSGGGQQPPQYNGSSNGGSYQNHRGGNSNNTNNQNGGGMEKSSSRRGQRDLQTNNSKSMTASGDDHNPKDDDDDDKANHLDGDGNYKVYWQRWIMLLYMSVLNLLSDWTCYSVAPIAVLTRKAYGEIDPEVLVTIFLAANAFASACEPIILSRLGLRRTVLFGALLLMIGSMIKSGGMPPIIQANLDKGHSEMQIYLGFFLVGLSQPLYQCTPALLSASWFPERERTMATGVALNANQLGIGFAFIFGTLLVETSDDIPSYFGLLSIVATVAFFGTLFQFDDAPPTPPSDSARVMRGTLEVNLPSVQTILQSIGVGNQEEIKREVSITNEATKSAKSSSSKSTGSKPRSSATGTGKVRRKSSSAGKKSRSSGGGPPTSDGRRRSRNSASRKSDGGAGLEPQAPPPSGALWGSVTDMVVSAPSPMMPGPVGGGGGGAPPGGGNDDNENGGGDPHNSMGGGSGYPYGSGGMAPMYPPGNYPPQGMSSYPPPQGGGYGPGPMYGAPPGMPGYSGYPPQGFAPGYQMGYPGYPQYPYPPPQQFYGQRNSMSGGGPYSYQNFPPRPDQQMYSDPYSVLPPAEGVYAGAEPVLTITPHHLDIDIRDDQILLAIRACFSRPGFIHSLVSFTVSGIVINTLSTYMDYLVRLNGAGREYTGIIGGSFQVVIMISSLIIGGMTDKSRAYYSVTIGMLVVGAFGLAECGVSLNADRGSDLRVALIVVAALVGPLQPVSTELGVEVVYPLSENTVLVIQQLFSNLLSALFIPVFKQLKDIGIGDDEQPGTHPEYTFSFYLLIVLHAGATVFFATFNGRYLRYEHELEKKDEKERKRQDAMEVASLASMGSFQPSLMSGMEGYESIDAERQPLVPHPQIV